MLCSFSVTNFFFFFYGVPWRLAPEAPCHTGPQSPFLHRIPLLFFLLFSFSSSALYPSTSLFLSLPWPLNPRGGPQYWLFVEKEWNFLPKTKIKGSRQRSKPPLQIL